jgi:hypothetical protein
MNSSFWVIPRRLNFIRRRFGTHCLCHLHRRVSRKNNRDEIVGLFIREEVIVLFNVINLFLLNLACAGFRLFTTYLLPPENMLVYPVVFRKQKKNLRDNYSIYSNSPITVRVWLTKHLLKLML